MTIFKYQLTVKDGDNLIQMSYDAKILCVQVQHEFPTIWVLVNPYSTEMRVRRIIGVGTGGIFDAEGKTYIGTVQDQYGYVWHYFDAGYE